MFLLTQNIFKFHYVEHAYVLCISVFSLVISALTLSENNAGQATLLARHAKGNTKITLLLLQLASLNLVAVSLHSRY